MVVSNPNIVCFDVDETLVNWTWEPGKDTIVIKTSWNTEIEVSPNHTTISKLISHSLIGHYVIVWSQGGNEWARAVVDGLGLTRYVNVIATKPKWYYDDIPADHWMGRIDPTKFKKED